MKTPEDLKYTKEHEWIKITDNVAIVGITDYAQSALGDIVYIDIDTLDDNISMDEVFGTIEAVKTVSDLFLPVTGKIIEINPLVLDNPELVNTDPYGDGWLIKIEIFDQEELDKLLNSIEYKNLVE
jgi:glycine cleavage system H protein